MFERFGLHFRLLFSSIRARDFVFQIHLLAFALALGCVGAVWVFPNAKLMQQMLLSLSAAGFAAGFSAWCLPYVRKVWAHPIGKAAIAILHLFVFVLATAFARFVVASALGLPPQDFDLAVSFVLILSYIPAWLIAISIVLAGVAIALEIVGFISMFADRPWGKVARLFAHMVGALAIFFFVGNVYQFAISHEKSLHPLVKWVAYYGDFQQAPLYPGVSADERIRLHENGVVSVARIQNGEIQILMRKFD